MIYMYIFNLMILLVILFSVYAMKEYMTFKSAKYVIFWMLIFTGVFTRFLAELSDYSFIAYQGKVLSLIFNTFAYIHLITILKSHERRHYHFIIYGQYFIEIAGLLLFMNIIGMHDTYFFMFFNAIVIFRTMIFTIHYKRYWFTAMCIFTGLYFVCGTYMLHDNITNYKIWIFNMIASIFGIIASIKNGNHKGELNHDS